MHVPAQYAHLQEDHPHIHTVAGGLALQVVWSRRQHLACRDQVVIDHPSRLSILDRLDAYPNVRAMLSADALPRLQQRGQQLRAELNRGIYIFGAYKIGMRLARIAREHGVAVIGFLDNDPGKEGQQLEGLPVHHPRSIPLQAATVVIASGQHSNAILSQLAQQYPASQLLNMHEFLYALDADHVTGAFANTAEAPARDPLPHLSAFLRLDDEHSRQVFDALIGMRLQLATQPAAAIRSPQQQEYFEPAFVSRQKAERFVDGGAAAGDTLCRLEAVHGPVQQAWLFEPELAPYYEALKNFSSRAEVAVFNMGLDATPTRAVYQRSLSYDIADELSYTLPRDIASFIQGTPLDALASGQIGLIKLDIEGMEARAIRGAKNIISRDAPTLAICAYHHADDYWQLMDEVLSIRPDYKVGMRLYADVLEDITLYFH